jgi:hypothetical protein
MATDNGDIVKGKRVVFFKSGPYSIMGDVPLIIKTQVVSKHG